MTRDELVKRIEHLTQEEAQTLHALGAVRGRLLERKEELARMDAAAAKAKAETTEAGAKQPQDAS